MFVPKQGTAAHWVPEEHELLSESLFQKNIHLENKSVNKKSVINWK